MKRTKHIVRLLVIAVLTVAMTLNMSSCGLMLLTAGGVILNDLMHEHEFGEWYIVTEPTCTEDGTQARNCTTCGEEEEEVLPATGHSIDHGACKNCRMITDAYDALAYFVRTNGSQSNSGNYYIREKDTIDGCTFSYSVYTDNSASTLTFYSESRSSSGYTLTRIDVDKGQPMHNVVMYVSLDNTFFTVNGTIQSSSFSSSNPYIYNFQSDAPYTLDSSLKELMQSVISGTLLAISTNILNDYNTGITMPMLGFSNY